MDILQRQITHHTYIRSDEFRENGFVGVMSALTQLSPRKQKFINDIARGDAKTNDVLHIADALLVGVEPSDIIDIVKCSRPNAVYEALDLLKRQVNDDLPTILKEQPKIGQLVNNLQHRKDIKWAD